MTAISIPMRGVLLAGLLAATTGLAQATAVAGDAGVSSGNSVGVSSSSPPVRRFVPSAAAHGADAPTLDLVSARIDAVDAGARAITVRGKPLPLHPTRLRVVGPGGQALSGARALRPGMQFGAPAPAADFAEKTPPCFRRHFSMHSFQKDIDRSLLYYLYSS